MRDEIAAKLISARNIEIYCPDKWKRKTRPKNEKTSISHKQELKEKAPPNRIAIDTQGVAVDEESMPSADDNTKGYLEDNHQRIEKHGANKLTNSEDLVDITTSPQYQELLFQNNELKEALEKATQLVQANTISSAAHVIDNQLDVLDFEFPLLLGDVRRYLVATYSETGDGSNVWFSGRIDKRTGRVVSARTGKIGRPKIDFGDSHSIGDV